MSSYKAFEIAGSGMSAQSVRLNTTASNLANAESVSGDPNKVYKARHPIFEAVRAQLSANAALNPDGGNAAVRVTGIYESQEPGAWQRLGTRDQHLRIPGAGGGALRAGQSAGQFRGLRVRPGGQRGRGDGQHDLGLALLPEQR